MTGSESTFLLTVLGLLLFVGLTFLYGLNLRFAENIRNALLWVLIFLGTLFVVSERETLIGVLQPSHAVATGDGFELRRASDGHFYVTLKVNGAPVDFVIDTGASQVVLSKRDARRVGFDTDALAYTGFAATANGEVRTARVTLDTVELGDLKDRDIAASVNGGEMFASLLGMSYLRLFEEISIRQDRMILKP